MNPITLLQNFAASCDVAQSVYGIPTWYKYLPGETDPADGATCRLVLDFNVGTATSFVAIGIAVIEIMLFVAGIVAVAFIIYGGFRYLISQGNPDQTKVAKDSILNALIGLAITIIATTFVRFLASRLS